MLRNIKPVLSIVTLLLTVLVATSEARAQQYGERVALLIANSHYEDDELPDLDNPENDTEALSSVLQSLGFEVTVVNDLRREELVTMLDQFRTVADDAAIALVFYAGHGSQLGGVNYLIPTDARKNGPVELSAQSVDLDAAIAATSGASQLRLIMIDACRDSPLGVPDGDGLRFVAIEPLPDNTLVAFATTGGYRAWESRGSVSFFTGAAAAVLPQPGVEVAMVFREIRDRVVANTHGMQQPRIYANLGGEAIYLAAPTETRPDNFNTAMVASIRQNSPIPLEDYVRDNPPGAWTEVAFATINMIRGQLADPLTQIAQARGGDAGSAAPLTIAGADAGESAAVLCDRFAANRADPDRPEDIPGVADRDLDPTAEALNACRIAAEEAAGTRRYHYQMARLLTVAGRDDDATAYLRAAANLGSFIAMETIAEMHIAAGEFAEAVAIYQTTAAAGNAPGINNLGIMYYRGQGVPADPARARELFDEAARMGWAGAQNNLGVLYAMDNNYAQARLLYEAADQLENPEGAWNLGRLILAGAVGTPDVAEGARLVAVSVSRHCAQAMAKLLEEPRSFAPQVWRAVQALLIEKGYLRGSADGVFGPMTAAALERWRAEG